MDSLTLEIYVDAYLLWFCFIRIEKKNRESAILNPLLKVYHFSLSRFDKMIQYNIELNYVFFGSYFLLEQNTKLQVRAFHVCNLISCHLNLSHSKKWRMRANEREVNDKHNMEMDLTYSAHCCQILRIQSIS